MKKRISVFLLAIGLAGCDSQKSRSSGPGGSSPKWYANYLDSPLSKGRVVYSEVALRAGETTTLKIPSDSNLVVGFILEKGYEIFKNKESVWIGTLATPHVAGGTPGVSSEFTPEDGVISLVVENGSSVDTRVVIYTQVPDQAPTSPGSQRE